MEANLPDFLGLFVQIPLVGIFVWFSLQLISTFLKSIDSRDEQWREFFNLQRESNNAAIHSMATRFSDEIRVLGKEISDLRGKMDK